MVMSPTSIQQVVSELSEASIGDVRRTRRLATMAQRIAERPGESLPDSMVTAAELQAAYQLLNQDDVKAEAIVDAHAQRTIGRCAGREDVVFIHDTTDFSFGGRTLRRGLGSLSNGGQGFRAHVCIAASLSREPLGTVGVQTLARDEEKSKRRNEALRWHELVQSTSARAQGKCSPIHVMDSEADDYSLLALLHTLNQRFVIRAAQDRMVGNSQHLSESLEGARVCVQRDVGLSPRFAKPTSKSRSKRNQPRMGRVATLAISSQKVEIQRPATRGSELPTKLLLNVVHVLEVDPPADEQPVEWILLTTEPIQTPADLERVVDVYRTRWLIEEFFKALKSGCGFEKSQLESRSALERFLGVLLPVAWQMLLLRCVGSHLPEAPADAVLTTEQLTVLSVHPDAGLPKNPTVHDALTSIARLGGHIKHNGAPGWMVLARGMRHVHEGVIILLALQKRRDQS